MNRILAYIYESSVSGELPALTPALVNAGGTVSLLQSDVDLDNGIITIRNKLIMLMKLAGIQKLSTGRYLCLHDVIRVITIENIIT